MQYKATGLSRFTVQAYKPSPPPSKRSIPHPHETKITVKGWHLRPFQNGNTPWFNLLYVAQIWVIFTHCLVVCHWYLSHNFYYSFSLWHIFLFPYKSQVTQGSGILEMDIWCQFMESKNVSSCLLRLVIAFIRLEISKGKDRTMFER